MSVKAAEKRRAPWRPVLAATAPTAERKIHLPLFCIVRFTFLNTADQTLSVKSRTQSWRWRRRKHIAHTSPRKRRRSSELPKHRFRRTTMTCCRWRRTHWPPPLPPLLRLQRAAARAPGLWYTQHHDRLYSCTESLDLLVEDVLKLVISFPSNYSPVRLVNTLLPI